MEITYTHAAGLDVHKKTVVACLFTPAPNGKPQKETRTFGTMTQDLLALADWLTSKGVTHVAMESTGEFGCPLGEASLQLAGRQLHRLGGQRPAYQDRPWPQNGRQRCRVDR